MQRLSHTVSCAKLKIKKKKKVIDRLWLRVGNVFAIVRLTQSELSTGCQSAHGQRQCAASINRIKEEASKMTHVIHAHSYIILREVWSTGCHGSGLMRVFLHLFTDPTGLCSAKNVCSKDDSSFTSTVNWQEEANESLTAKWRGSQSTSLQRWCPFSPHSVAGWVGDTLVRSWRERQ